MICSKKARDMLGTWAKHGQPEMGEVLSMKLHGSIQEVTCLRFLSLVAWRHLSARTNEENDSSVQVEGKA